MIQNYQCPKCSQKFTSLEVKSGKCPDCNKWMNYLEPTKTSDTNGQVPAVKQSVKREATISDLVEAQDRTTSAVRSLALYFFITLQTSLFGIGLVMLVPSLAALGAVIVIGGFLAGVILGSSELSKSKL